MSDKALADTPFNHKPCTVPGFEECWVRFKTSGYPRKLRREWDESKTADGTLAIVLDHAEAWNIRDLDGGYVPQVKEIRNFDNVEESVCVWLVREFQTFWLVELPAPRKNSLPLSTSS